MPDMSDEERVEDVESLHSIDNASDLVRTGATIHLTSTQASRWQRRAQPAREDLEPGSEYHLTISKTLTRDPNYHDPAIWDHDLVDWDSPTDPANPRNWPMRKKIIVTVQLGVTTMGASFASSSFSPAFAAIEQVFGISRTVATLSLSLFVLGYLPPPRPCASNEKPTLTHDF